ncbi:hypothetical protein [Candidatus Poriferisocius sp.]|uniref:hypothetical protein n=1 Tax=Candidatus Poriferisocius sp. TaxID=3101276 RepID=UPI003B02A3E4
MIHQIFRRRDLGVIDSFIAAGILVVAVFTWAERSEMVDPNTDLADNWSWRLWQIGPVVFSLIGVWLLWRNTSKVPWFRTLCLSSLAMAILLNQYTDFFDHSVNLWNTIDPLFIACATVAVGTGWGRVMAQRQGMEPASPFTLIAVVIALGLAVSVFVNNYFVGDEGAWDVLDPLMILSLLTWAIAARRTNVGDAI